MLEQILISGKTKLQPNTLLTMNKSRIVAPLAIASVLLTSAIAQDSADSSDEDDIFELSPFTIDASEDTGYRAKNTLSGSRLKVSLDDISTPLDIITPELMEDFAVSDLDDLMNVVSNVEEGDNLFFDQVYANGSNYRIRGFYNVTQLRNFMGGRMSFDSYNSTRLVAAKGPNAVLYGTGPAGGALSFFTKQHQLGSKDTTSFKVELDNWGTRRTSFDTDRTLIDGKLGFHLSLLNDDRKYEIEPDYQEKNGYYLGVKYAPLENTIISATYERRTEDSFRGSGNFTAMEDRSSAWLANGKALVTGSNSVIVDGVELTGVNIKDYGVYWNNARRTQQNTVLEDGSVLNWGRKALSDRAPVLSSWQTDRRFRDLNWPQNINPTGVNGGAYVDQEAWDLTIEQKVNDNFYLMAVFGENNMDREQYQMRIRQAEVDVNYYLPGDDGAFSTELNPNAGMLYLNMGAPSMWTRLQGTKTNTFTATYELDLEGDVNKWLGKHNFATMYSNQVATSGGNQGKFLLSEHPDAVADSADGVWTYHDMAGKTSYRNTQYLDLNFRQYVDFETGGYMRDLRYLVDQGYYEEGDKRWDYIQGQRIDHSRNDTTSKMGVVQSTWLGKRLVTTVGYRTEEIDYYRAFTGANPDNYALQSFYDFYTKEEEFSEGFTRTFLPTLDARPEGYGARPYETVEGISKNIGGVFKITPKLALTYSKAQNISGGNPRVGLFGTPLAIPGGRSEDMGIRWNLLDGKLRIEYSKYETATANGSTHTGGNKTPLGSARQLMEVMNSEFVGVDNGEGGYDVMANPNRANFVDPFTEESKWDTFDDAAVGHEISITGSPIKGSSLRLMITKNENTKANMGGEWRAWWAENGDTLMDWAAANGNLHRATAGTVIVDGVEVPSWSFDQEDAARKATEITDLHQAREIQEQLPNYNLASWSAKFVGKYSFQDGKLKGQQFGANVAWRDKIITGHWKAEDGLDIDRPLYMPDTTFVSLFWNYTKKIQFAGHDAKWKIQFNVDNVFDSYGSMPRSPRNLGPEADAEVAYWGLKYNRGRQYKLTNSISF